MTIKCFIVQYLSKRHSLVKNIVWEKIRLYNIVCMLYSKDPFVFQYAMHCDIVVKGTLYYFGWMFPLQYDLLFD